jgi:hypothetical protein
VSTPAASQFEIPTSLRAGENSKSHQRKLVDCSDPASENNAGRAHTRTPSFMGLLSEQVGSEPSTNCRWWDCGGRCALISRRGDLNHPPTAVGGIPRTIRPRFCRFDSESFTTFRGGDSKDAAGWGIECWVSINYDVSLTKDDKVIEKQH